MNDDRLERLLGGYALPAVSARLDRRVIEEGAAIVERGHEVTIESVGRSLLHGLGFGYVTWLVDLVTATEAEYQVELI